tara:strand:- start:5063 stop:5206 length:144 start_codon:yes stop_codon:yes gene_type:complete
MSAIASADYVANGYIYVSNKASENLAIIASSFLLCLHVCAKEDENIF